MIRHVRTVTAGERERSNAGNVRVRRERKQIESEASVKSYYGYNAHGDVVQQNDGGGAVTKTYRYDAFGVEQNQDASDTNVWRYCGEYWDVETETIYLRARYYNPRIGRFTQSDPAQDGLNWYTYANNNPIYYIDPSGMVPWDASNVLGTRDRERLAELTELYDGYEAAGDEAGMAQVMRSAEAILRYYGKMDYSNTLSVPEAPSRALPIPEIEDWTLTTHLSEEETTNSIMSKVSTSVVVARGGEHIPPRVMPIITTGIIVGVIIGAIIGGVAGVVISYDQHEEVKWQYVVGGAVVGGLVGAGGAVVIAKVGTVATTIAASQIGKMIADVIPNRIHHIMQPKHAWDLVGASNWSSVSNVIDTVLTKGTGVADNVGNIIYSHIVNGKTVEVTTRVVNGVIQIVDAWVKTK